MTLPNIKALISVAAGRVQDVEDVAYTLILGRALPWATGKTLDLWGEVVGRPRSTGGPDAFDDAVYKALLLGQIVANTSNGDREAVLGLMRLLGADDVILANDFPAGLRLEFHGALITSDADTVALLAKATTAVSLGVTQRTDHPFGFASDPTASGFGDGELARTVI